MAVHSLGQETLELVERWRPERAYRHEARFRDDLHEHLTEYFNQKRRPIHVAKERGKSRGDIVVDDRVGIELKNRFSNDQERELIRQLKEYQEEYDFVIALACGIDDHDGWNRVK